MAINQFKISFTHPTLSHFLSSNFSSAEQLATLPPVSTLPHCHRRAPISQPHWVIFSSLSLRLSPSPSCSGLFLFPSPFLVTMLCLLIFCFCTYFCIGFLGRGKELGKVEAFQNLRLDLLQSHHFVIFVFIGVIILTLIWSLMDDILWFCLLISVVFIFRTRREGESVEACD